MKIVGPIFWFEMARVSRRNRTFTGRCLYVGILLVILGFIYASLFDRRGPENVTDFLFRSQANPKDLATFGMTFFLVFTFLQYFLGTIAVAAASAAILTEEKEKHTLPFLLTTTLRDREIVLGKLSARVTHVFLMLAAGLPVLAIMQVMGGIDPVLLGYSFVAIVASVLSAAALGAFASVYAESVKSATMQAVMTVLIYHLICPYVGFILQMLYGAVPILPTPWGFMSLGAFIDYVNSGSLIWMASRLGRVFGASGNLGDLLMPMLAQFLAFHAVVAGLAGGWCAFRLRKSLARQSERGGNQVKKKQARRRSRKPVSQTRPVWWRETTTAVSRPGQKRWHRWGRRIGFLASFFPLSAAIYEGAIVLGRPDMVARNVHGIVQGIGTVVTSFMLLQVAVNASAMIGRERRKQTLDELQLTELSNREILTQKALASVWPARWALIWIGIHWTIDLVLGGMHPLALLGVPIVVWFYFLLATSLGMFCSVYETPKYRATVTAALGMFLYALLPWLLPLGHAVVLDGSGKDVEKTALFAMGICPPSAIGAMTIGVRDYDWIFRADRNLKETRIFLSGLATGLVLCTALSALLWSRTKRRFSAIRRE